MKMFLATKLTVEQCADRLHNAIDPVPAPEERVKSAQKTTWSPSPLPGAGRRTTGFGYAPGTRPVVGTIADGRFYLEKRVVYSRGSNQTPIIAASCSGHMQPAPYGTLIELEMQRPRSSILHSFLAGLFSLVFGLVGVCMLSAYFTGAATAPASKTDLLGACVAVLFLAFPLVIFLTTLQAGAAERQYLLKFLRLVCQASSLSARKMRKGEGYTGATQRL